MTTKMTKKDNFVKNFFISFSVLYIVGSIINQSILFIKDVKNNMIKIQQKEKAILLSNQINKCFKEKSLYNNDLLLQECFSLLKKLKETNPSGNLKIIYNLFYRYLISASLQNIYEINDIEKLKEAINILNYAIESINNKSPEQINENDNEEMILYLREKYKKTLDEVNSDL